MCGTKTTNEIISLSLLCVLSVFCVCTREVRVKSRMRKVVSLLFSFLFFSLLLCVCVGKMLNFSMLWKNKKKFKKSKQTPKQKREREREDKLTNVSKTPSSSSIK